MSDSVERIVSRFPSWSRARTDQNANVRKLLAGVGEVIDSAESILLKLLDETTLVSADINQVSTVYRAAMPPDLIDYSSLIVFGGGSVLQPTKSLEEFMTSLRTDPMSDRSLFYNNPFYIDSETRFIYTRHSYDGKLRLKYVSTFTLSEVSTTVELEAIDVWNTFDEYGLLLGCPRRPGEPNALYKERLLNVFRFRAGPTRSGYVNSVASSLGLIRSVLWPDGGSNLTIPDPLVVQGTVIVDDEPFVDVEYSDTGFTLKGDASYAGKSRTVRYIWGIQVYDLLSDKVQELLYEPPEVSISFMQSVLKEIEDTAPVSWGKFKWDHGYFLESNVTTSIPCICV